MDEFTGVFNLLPFFLYTDDFRVDLSENLVNKFVERAHIPTLNKY
jgi:hypothetical protein